MPETYIIRVLRLRLGRLGLAVRLDNLGSRLLLLIRLVRVVGILLLIRRVSSSRLGLAIGDSGLGSLGHLDVRVLLRLLLGAVAGFRVGLALRIAALRLRLDLLRLLAHSLLGRLLDLGGSDLDGGSLGLLGLAGLDLLCLAHCDKLDLKRMVRKETWD